MQEYNSLLGETITIDKLEELIQLAINKEQSYLLELLSSAKEIAAKHGYDNFKLSTQVVDQIPASILSAIDKLPDYIDAKDIEGLNAAVSPDDIYTMITNKMIERIKVVTGKEYKKKWDSGKVLHGKGFLTPMNFVSGKAYRGINFFMLKDFDIFKVFENPYFLTFKQIQTLKGKLKKGSKGHEVVYFTTLYKIHIKSSNGDTIVDFGTYNKKRYEKFIDENWAKIAPHTKTDKNYHKNKYIPILKYYNVFNGADVEDIDFKLEELEAGKLEPEKPANEELQLAEGIVNNYPEPQPKIMHGGDKAAYFVDKNAVQMPHKEAFETIQDYYRTLFHELSHSTGDVKHLNREQDSFKRNPLVYAFEELIAEFGAVFLSAQAGFLWQSNKNHAEYVKHWSMHLKNAEKDNRYIMRAASAAQKSTDYVLNLDKEGVPAYLKDAAKQIKKEKEENVTPTKYTKEKFEKDLPELETIIQSYRGISLSPDKRGKDELKEWGGTMAEIYARNNKLAQKHNKVDEFHSTFDTLYPRLLKRKEDLIRSRSGVLSSMVTGPSGYPVASQKKKQSTYDDRMGEYFKYSKYFEEKLRSAIFAREIITSGESDTLVKLKEKLDELEKTHKQFLAANKAHRDWHKSKDEKVFENTDLKPSTIKVIKELGNTERPIAAFQLSNSRQNINATKKRIKAEEARAEKYSEGNKETKFDHYTVLENVDENRLQILFDGKPSDAVREVLKKNGFRWSGKNVAWQRQLTKNAIFTLRHTLPELNKILEEETTPALNAARHEGKAKEALTSCGRLKRGYRYEKGGKIVKVNTSDKAKIKQLKKPAKTKKTTNAGSNQAALFGAKKEKKRSKLTGVSNILSEVETQSEFFKVPGAVGEFLQQVERKPVHSVVVTLDGAQGAGKTTTLYRFINSFASAQLPCVYFSLEEHPESHLAREKVNRYIDKENVPYIDAVGELDSKEQFYKIVDQYDFIFIDSWQKLVREIGNIKLDEDLRKKFNGKVFVIIFQQTTTGRTKGGAEIVFDGDIIIKMVKEPRFEDNYAYMDKNRYTLRPIDELRYNIAGDYTYSTVEDEDVGQEEEIAFNFLTE